LHLAALAPLGDNGKATNYQGYVDTD